MTQHFIVCTVQTLYTQFVPCLFYCLTLMLQGCLTHLDHGMVYQYRMNSDSLVSLSYVSSDITMLSVILMGVTP